VTAGDKQQLIKITMNPDSEGSHAKLVAKALSGTRWASLIRIAAQLISWVGTFFVVRWLQPEDFGLNAMLESPVLIFTFFSTLGLEAAIVQKRELSDKESGAVFGFLLLINTTLFAAFFLMSPLIASYYGEPKLEKISQVMALIFLLVPFRVVPNAMLDRALDFKLKAQVQLVATVISSITSLVLAFMGFGIWALIYAVIADRVTQAILLMIMRPWFIMPTFRFGEVTALLGFGTRFALASALLVFGDMLITLIAGPRIGAHQLGVFAIASQFAMMPLSKGMPLLNQTMMPAFSRLQSDKDLIVYYLMRLLGVASLLFLPVGVGLALVSDLFVEGIIGIQWQESVPVLIVLSLAMVFRLIHMLIRAVIASIGKAGELIKVSAIHFVAILTLVFVAIPYGVTALAIAWLAAETIAVAVIVFACTNLLPFRLQHFFSTLVPSVSSALGMAVIVLLIDSIYAGPALIQLAVQVSLGAATYFVIARFCFREQFQVAEKLLLGRNVL
jgi:O-antigen/teichoic acid export membrane protein